MDTFGKSGPIGDVIGEVSVISVGSLKYRIVLDKDLWRIPKGFSDREIRFEPSVLTSSPAVACLLGAIETKLVATRASSAADGIACPEQ